MAFRFIRNRAQDIAVKGGAATLVLCIVLAVFKILPIDITLPFMLLWIMVWIIGAAMNTNNDE